MGKIRSLTGHDRIPTTGCSSHLLGAEPWHFSEDVCSALRMMLYRTGAFARLSVRELTFHLGQGELKNGASRFIRIRPQPAPMGTDDGPAD
jgi:hypothetical protein